MTQFFLQTVGQDMYGLAQALSSDKCKLRKSKANRRYSLKESVREGLKKLILWMKFSKREIILLDNLNCAIWDTAID